MKLKTLTSLGMMLMLAFVVAFSSCTKDEKETTDKDPTDNSPKPTVTLKQDLLGGTYWVSRNMVWPVGTKVRFGLMANYDKEIVNIKVTRKVIDGPGAGQTLVLLDSNINSKKFPMEGSEYEMLVDGPQVQQVLVFTFAATAADGSVGELSIEIRPDVTLGKRMDETLWDRNANGAYDVVQGVSINKDQEQGRHDMVLIASGGSFKLGSGNGSKFKMYNGTTLFDGFNSYATLQTGWNGAGAELNETVVLSEVTNDYKFVMVKSAQNNRIYVLDVFEINADHVYFDLIGEGL